MPRTAVARRVAARAENRCIAEEFEAKALQIGLQGDEPAPRERAIAPEAALRSCEALKACTSPGDNCVSQATAITAASPK